MNEWVSFRGVRSDTIPNVRVAELPVAPRAQMRYTKYTVPGRD